MDYRLATIEDIPGVEQLQQRYHVSTISDEDRPDGFVTTLFTSDQFRHLIEDERGLSIAVDGAEIVGYAMAASWDYWSAWSLFQHMIADLPNMTYLGVTLDTENSYQYGPICVDKKYRSTDVFPNLFEFSRREMMRRYPILVTFINQINGRSMRAHEKIELDIIKPFVFNRNNYYALGYDMSKRTPGSTI
jgi:hypothetical protein